MVTVRMHWFSLRTGNVITVFAAKCSFSQHLWYMTHESECLPSSPVYNAFQPMPEKCVVQMRCPLML